MNAQSHAEQCFREGLELLQLGRGAEALAALTLAEEAGARDASMVLGHAYLHGEPLTPDPMRAVLHLERAAAKPWGPPEMLIAAILRIGHGLDADPPRAWHWLQRAIDAGHPPALRTVGILRAIAGDATGAREWLDRAVTAGDGFARHAQGLLAAACGDAAGAQSCFEASSLPISERRRRLADPIVWPTDGPSWTLESGVAPWADPPRRGKRQRLHAAPLVEIQDQGLSPWECDYLLTIGAPNLQSSRTLDPRDGGVVADPARSSSDVSMRTFFPDLVVHGAALALAEFAGLPLQHSEALAMLRYGIGQEYRPHFDFFSPAMLDTPRFREQGQRVTTVIAYLNPVPAGGTTTFPTLELRVEPQAGRLLRFDNVLPNGAIDSRSLHCGDPVLSGDKWIVTAWFRERPAATYRFGQIPGGC